MSYLLKAHRRECEEDHGRRSGHSPQVVHQATATDEMKQQSLPRSTYVSDKPS